MMKRKTGRFIIQEHQKKIGLPVGTYQLEINGTMQEIKIKDGETVEF